MEEIIQRHKKETRDLQSRITQNKKSATKKNRKAINDECLQLERDLSERQNAELHPVGDGIDQASSDGSPAQSAMNIDEPLSVKSNGSTPAVEALKSMHVHAPPNKGDHVRKPNRQKARLARRAAEQAASVEQAEKEALNLPDLRETEMQSMKEAYSARGLTEQDIRSDGHCLYAAVADQLSDAKLDPKPSPELQMASTCGPGYGLARQVAAAYIEQHAEDFAPFLDTPLKVYVDQIRNTGEWGGHLELLALSKAYDVNINVLHGDGHVDTIESGSAEPRASIWLAYYHHSHGLGEHYNSLRRIP